MALNIFRNIFSKLTHTHRSTACTGPFGLVPQELLDLIIAHLVNDKATLLSCALVHPTWTSISRYHLPPLTLVVSSPSRAKDLTKLLRSSRETLSWRITGITLVGEPPRDDLTMNDLKSPHARSYHKLLHHLQLKGVSLRSGAVEKDPSLVGLLAHHYPDLAALKVSCSSYQDITGFMRALSGSFPHLAELDIDLGSRGMDIPDAPLHGLGAVKLSVPCLRTLRVVGWNNQLVRWLGDNITGTLECLELVGASMRSTCRRGEASSLITRNKKTLKDLRLIFAKRHGSFDLSSLVHLENLEVAGAMDEMYLAFDGWRLPRSLNRVYFRNVICVFPGLCHTRRWDGDDRVEGIVTEGAMLRGALGWQFDQP